MRVIAVSLLVAAPAFVSAVAVPVRRDNSGYATWYDTQTGNAYVIHTFPAILADLSTPAVLAALI